MCLEIALCYNLIKSKLKERETADKIVRRKDNCFIIDFFSSFFFFYSYNDEEFKFCSFESLLKLIQVNLVMNYFEQNRNK